MQSGDDYPISQTFSSHENLRFSVRLAFFVAAKAKGKHKGRKGIDAKGAKAWRGRFGAFPAGGDVDGGGRGGSSAQGGAARPGRSCQSVPKAL